MFWLGVCLCRVGERSLGLSEYRANIPYDNHKLPESKNWISYGCNLDRQKINLLCCTFASEKLVEGENSECRTSCLYFVYHCTVS